MKVNFLDVVIKIKNGRLSTDLYSKPVDSHQYLHYNSCHPEHIKKSIIYSQTLRLRRICSERKDLKSHVRDLKGWFLRRGYPQRIIEEQVDRAFRLPLENDTQQNKMENDIALVVTYSPAFRNLIFFTQMQRLERFLRQAHLLPIEVLETLRIFS